MTVLFVPFCLLVLAAFSVDQSLALTCYVGSMSSQFAYGELSRDPVVNNATLQSGCDQCTQSMMAARGLGYLVISWKCDTNDPDGDTQGCAKHVEIAQGQGLDQVDCSCCTDKCNANNHCNMWDMLPPVFSESPRPTTTPQTMSDIEDLMSMVAHEPPKTKAEKLAIIGLLMMNFCDELEKALNSTTGAKP